MYEETALEILDPCITAHEEAHIEDFFRTKASCAPSWTKARRDWAFEFFGIEMWKRACNFKYFDAAGRFLPFHSYFCGFTKWSEQEPGANNFSKCCGLSEITVEARDSHAVSDYQKELNLKILVPLWKARLFQVLFNRKAGAIATINKDQESLLPALLDFGFKIQSEWMYNPNSGNEIMLLFFQFPR